VHAPRLLDAYTGYPYETPITVDFEWDDAKAASNLDKHRIAFDDAIGVFADPNVVIVATIREEDGEDRFKAIGRIGDRVFTVVYAERNGMKRLISARRANRKEEKRYGDDAP
jgi:uncharacterized DUF497 family protein